MVDSIIQTLAEYHISPEFIVFIISLLPFIELRGSIPAGVFLLNLPLWETLIISILGNIVIIPIIMVALRYFELLSTKFSFGKNMYEKLESSFRKKHTNKVEKYKMLALFIFVAIPLPGTGAWTGSIIAHIFRFPLRKSFFYIAGGVIVAGLAVAALSGSIRFIL
jgi:uncharacterized membrane protein